MKHFAKSLVLSSAILLSLMTSAYAAQAAPPPENGYKVQVNDELIAFPDAQPFVDGASQLQVPVRFVSEKLGYEAHWEQQGDALKITLSNKSNTFLFTTGQTSASLNDQPITLQSAPQMVNGRAYIPVRLLADTLKIQMQWDADNHIAILDEDGKYHAPACYSPAYQKVIEGKATAYTGSPSENGGHPSIDYFGNPLQVGTISVDPSIIPLGSKVYIEGYNYDGLPAGGMYATASDTGSAIKGNKIDIYVPDDKTKATQFGIQQVKIYVLK
ncbi:stalk domain-containing protein [Paenibacillus doosanensis]|uniref:Cell wall-binding protein YocH n=1 Tax=Paenibacillus konkukensis TaxID=2020716 RepID=A0ABY4RV10_9BACL|nr:MULTISPECIES: stalk domain-containing protein [Paenibacillus]MCS7465022.1 stalk domain-containing protein [Paenibacillus doosanensis]UQZ85229.1 Cell wall-binding protein YocH precursor [Paenibacillus konkukensis]